MVETGETLRSTRESSGVSLDEVSKDLNIPVIYLEQIEAGATGSFEDIYELKKMILDYSKYLGLDTEMVVAKFNDYLFESTSKIQLDEIEKAVKEKMKEESDEDRICSPYTKAAAQEKPLPYVIAFIVIIILVILAFLWSVKQITVNNITNNLVSYYYKD